MANATAILSTLAGHDVDYLVAGGYAVQVHGHVRTTRDLDIIPNPGVRNMRRVAAALAELEAVAIDEDGGEVPIDLSEPELLAVGDYFLGTRAGALDLVNGTRPDLKRYLRLEARSLRLEVAGHAIRFVGRDDLIAMKREAGRPQDLRDIAALDEVQRRERG